jgi:outer membrane cobalamin receptor
MLRASGSVTKTNPALWVATDVQAGPVLLVPSLRVDNYSLGDQLGGTLVVQPRFDARWAATDTTTVKGGVGFYSEAADIDETNHIFGNPKAGPDLAVHYSAGAEQRLGDAVSLDVTGFYKHFYHVLSPVDDPSIKYANTGKGRAYGAEVMLRHDLRSRFYGWLAYTLQRSERLDPGATEYRLFDTDQTHNVTAIGQYRLTPTWEIGARFRYVTGSPSTPVEDATYDSDADTYVPVYGAANSTRLGAFHQLDVRVDKHFVFEDWKLTAYVDVQNVYNQANADGVNYNYDYSESQPATGLPLLPSFGVRGEF